MVIPCYIAHNTRPTMITPNDPKGAIGADLKRIVRWHSSLREWWRGLGWIDLAGCVMLLSIGLNCWAGILQRRNADRLRDVILNNQKP